MHALMSHLALSDIKRRSTPLKLQAATCRCAPLRAARRGTGGSPCRLFTILRRQATAEGLNSDLLTYEIRPGRAAWTEKSIDLGDLPRYSSQRRENVVRGGSDPAGVRISRQTVRLAVFVP